MGYIGAGVTRFNTADELTVTGDAQIDTTTLVVDSTNNRVGIGTTSPTNPLHISSSAGEAILISNSSASGNSQIKLDGATDFQIGTGQASSGFANKFFLYDATNAATRMVVDNSGNVGIGIAAPSTKIHLNESGSANAVQRIQAGTNGYAAQLHLYGNNVGGAAYNSVASYVNGDSTPQWEITGPEASAEDQMLFHTGGTERMRIDSSGNVGIGTSSPSFPLTIENSANHLYLKQSNQDNGWLINTADADGKLHFYRRGEGASPSNNELLTISTGGAVGIGQSSPATPLHINGVPGTSTLRLDAGGTLGGARRNWAISAEKYAAGALSIEYGSTEGAAPSNAAMTINSSGRVGIGTTSPQEKIHFHKSDSGSSAAIFTNSTTGSGVNNGLFVGLGSDEIGYFYSYENNHLIFGNNNTERMRILTTGELCLNDTARTLACVQHLSFDGANEQGLCIKNTVNNQGGAAVRFIDYTGAQSGGGIYFTSSNSITYATSSDARLKENVADMTGAIDRVKALAPKRFNWVADDDDTTVDGFLAHEAQAVVPEAVTGTKDAMRNEEYEVTPAVLDDDGNVVTEAVMGTRSVPDYQGIDQSKLVPLLTGALQEAIAKIEDLETRLAALEGA